ncbi:hypothetical protein [Xylocopilactobacillus apis]|uniref:Uncharacterized protein n=1 Tax=Xylocopilactobacillus apis TaxID=2932183 RepID=A0AAU9DSQ8_9LACO|nr:hypothetical protein [Xylocopilactobacillus apis]BDR56748.1 hypothetical protein KIMC2_13100 [Xylocopilactobacillus apis]
MKELKTLYSDVWYDLAPDLQLKNFQQILRYFVSPLSEIQEIKQVEHRFMNQQMTLCEVVIDGLRYVFVPGIKEFQMSYDRDLFTKKNQLLFAINDGSKELKVKESQYHKFFDYAYKYTVNRSDTYRIDPMLVSVTALPVSGTPVGYYNMYDGRKIISTVVNNKFQSELAEFFKTKKETAHFFWRENSLEKVAQVFKKSILHPDQLMENFSKRGVNFIDAREYYYIKSGGANTFFPWGNSLDPQTVDRLYYLPNQFGIKIRKDDDNYLMTDNPFRFMDGVVLPEGYLTKYIKYASFFDSGFVPVHDYFKKPIEEWEMEYRPVIRIKID